MKHLIFLTLSTLSSACAQSVLSTPVQVHDAARTQLTCLGELGVSQGNIALKTLKGEDPNLSASALGTPSKATAAIQGVLPVSREQLQRQLAPLCGQTPGGWLTEMVADGGRFALVVWKPLLTDSLQRGDRSRAQAEMLEAVNRARATPRMCGNQAYAAAGPLQADNQLRSVILAYVTDQLNYNYTGHTGRDQSDPAARTTRAGISWQQVGENLAYGTGGAVDSVNALLDSPGHCRNIMNPNFTRMGTDYVIGGKWGVIWGQLFAR